jgi:uncharacterized ferredoxin-like protein
MMTIVLGSVAWGAGMPKSIDNDKALKSALKAARTPKDHERIAAYYRAKAARLDAEAAGFDQAAQTSRNSPVVKNLTAPNTAARYADAAKALHQQAQSNRQFAASQEQFEMVASRPSNEARPAK